MWSVWWSCPGLHQHWCIEDVLANSRPAMASSTANVGCAGPRLALRGCRLPAARRSRSGRLEPTCGHFEAPLRRRQLKLRAIRAHQPVRQRIEVESTCQRHCRHDLWAGDEVHRACLSVVPAWKVAVVRGHDCVCVSHLVIGPSPLPDARSTPLASTEPPMASSGASCPSRSIVARI